MAGQPQSISHTPEEYLRAERRAQTRSEYLDGKILAMSGASLSHNALVANLIMELGPPLRSRGLALVEMYRRHSVGSWLYSRVDGPGGSLEVLGVELSLEALYAGVRLAE